MFILIKNSNFIKNKEFLCLIHIGWLLMCWLVPFCDLTTSGKEVSVLTKQSGTARFDNSCSTLAENRCLSHSSCRGCGSLFSSW